MAGLINREKIGSVTRADGTTYSVHLLKVADLKGKSISAPDFPFEMAALSLGITRAEFEEWDITDAIKVMNMLNEGVTKL